MEEILQQLVNLWVHKTLARSNDGAAKAIRPHDKELVRFKLISVGGSSKDAIENKHPSQDEVFIWHSSLQGKTLGSTYIKYQEEIDRETIQYPNPSTTTDLQGECKLSTQRQHSREKEKTKEWQQRFSAELGGAAFGAQGKLGYEAAWSVSTTDKNQVQQGQGREVTIPVLIPPGGASYTFTFHQGECYQDYTLDAFILRGTLTVNFDNRHSIIYDTSQRKFVRTDSHSLSQILSNKVSVSLADVFKDLKDEEEVKAIFPEMHNWAFKETQNQVNYSGKICLFHHTAMDIKTDAKVNSSSASVTTTPSSSPSASTTLQSDKTDVSSLLQNPSSLFKLSKQKTGVKMPETSAQSETLNATVKEKIKAGISQDPNIALFLDKLTNSPHPLSQTVENFLIAQINKLTTGVEDPDAKHFLSWVTQNHQIFKDRPFVPHADIIADIVDLQITSEKETQKENTGPST